MKALILAGGFGTRLIEVIHDRPKVMAPIRNKPFLEYVLTNLRKNGIENIIISIGYLGGYIKNHFGDGEEFGVNISYSSESYPLGTAGAIKNASKYIRETFLVVNGDTYLDFDLDQPRDFHDEKKACATIFLAKRGLNDSGLVILGKSGKVIKFYEKPEKETPGFVNTGYYIFNPMVFDFIGSGKRVSLEKEVFPKLSKKEILYGYPVDKGFIDIGTPGSYKKAIRILSRKKSRVIYAKAPVRVSFFGGGTDIPIFFKKGGGRVLSGTIDKYAKITVKQNDNNIIKLVLENFKIEKKFPLSRSLPYDNSIFDLYKAVFNRMDIDSGIDIFVTGDFPGGSGLGSSSAICVSLVAALMSFKNKKIRKEDVAKLAIEIEREILRIPGGWQDQYESVYGGMNEINFLPNNKVKISRLSINNKLSMKLQDTLTLYYLGTRRAEKDQQSYLVKNIEKGKILEILDLLKGYVSKGKKYMMEGNVESFGKLLDEAWLAKKSLTEKVTNSRIDNIYDLAKENGAWGGKLLGAGGGGCLLISAPKKSQTKIEKLLKDKGVKKVPFNFEFEGLSIYYENC